MAHNSDYEDAGARVVAAEQGSMFAVDRLARRRGGEPMMHEGHYVWLGDLAGFYLSADYDSDLTLTHGKCNTDIPVPTPHILFRPDGWEHDRGEYGAWLANIVVQALEHRCPEAQG